MPGMVGRCETLSGKVAYRNWRRKRSGVLYWLSASVLPRAGCPPGRGCTPPLFRFLFALPYVFPARFRCGKSAVSNLEGLQPTGCNFFVNGRRCYISKCLAYARYIKGENRLLCICRRIFPFSHVLITRFVPLLTRFLAVMAISVNPGIPV